jgi:hypothetical protein
MLLQIMNLKNELRSISVDAQLLTEAIWDRYSHCWFFNQARNIIILRVLLGFFFSCLHITKLEAQVNLYRYLTQISPLKNVCMLNTSKFYHSNPIGFYVKTMSAHGSHLGWRSWSPDTILKVYYPRTIHAIFALNWLTGFRGEDLNNFPIGLMLKLWPLTVAILDRDRGHWTQFWQLTT